MAIKRFSLENQKNMQFLDDCKSKSNLALPQGDDVNSLADDSNGILQCKNKTRILT